jgi:hypothetical protein
MLTLSLYSCLPTCLWEAYNTAVNMGGRLTLFKQRMGKPRASLALVVGILLTIATSLSVLSFLYHAYRVVLFPYELANGEELLLRHAVQIIRGQAVYAPVNDPPFIWFGKPPLFPALAGSLIPLVGRSLAATRLVATVSTLLIPLLIGGIIYQRARRIIPSAICGGIYLGSVFVYQWGAWGRVDATAIVFSLLAILVVSRWRDKRGILLAASCCLLSLYTKQTQWAAPIAIILWLLWRRRWPHALGFALLLGGVGGALFSLLTVVTDRQFYLHLVVYNVLEYSYRAFFGYWRAYLIIHAGIATVAILAAAIYLKGRRPTLTVLYFATSALMTVTVGRMGASSNYFLDAIAVTLLLCGLLWSELSKRGTYLSLVVPVALLLQLVWFKAFPFSQLAVYYAPAHSFGYTPQASDVRAGEEIDRYVRDVDGEILTEAGGFAVRNGKELYANPLGLNALDRQGLASEALAQLEEALAQHRFSLVILTWQSYPPRVLNAVWANYHRVHTVDCVFRYEIFVPAE